MASQNLSIYYQNVRGLRTKCLQLSQSILGNNYDIILLTETWLHAGIFDGELCDDRYDVFRSDRDLTACAKATGGGVMIMTKRSLGAMRSGLDPSAPTEMLSIKVPARMISATNDLIICVAYVPPDPHRIPSDVDSIIQALRSGFDRFSRHNFLLVGDFNLPCISWDKSGPTHLRQGSVEVQNAGLRLVEDLGFLGLTQYNIVKNYKGNTLDLAFSNLPLNVSLCSYPLIKQDNAHPSFTIEVLDLTISPLTEISSSRHNFNKGDYVALNSYFSELHWYTLLGSGSIEESTEVLYKIIKEAIVKYIPLTHKPIKRHYPIWYSSALIKIIKEKTKAHSRWKKFGNLLDYDEFALLRNRQQRVQDACFNKYITNIENILEKKPNSFWAYIKSMRGGSNYPRMLTYNGRSYTEGKNICDAFSDFFQSVFGSPSVCYTPSEYEDTSNDFISELSIPIEIVKRSLSALDITKGSGSDGIPPLFWSKCAQSLATPIAHIFNRSLSEGSFPNTWKQAHIVPLHKKGSRTNVENYRGISILNTIGKVFERLVYNAIYPVLHKGMSDKQHGFLRRRSTVTNLTCFSNYLLNNMERGGQVDVIYTDFEKAFDRVDHVILLDKLHRLGIRGNLLRWVQSYLKNRSQAVVVGGFRSNFVGIPTGVPQGSHLGPLFYNAYLYDITNCFKFTNHLMYADDKKIFYKIKNVNSCDELQADLNSLSEYYKMNNITINVNKCQCISFTRKTNPTIYTYKFENSPINRTVVVRDLGVHFDQRMLLADHVDYVTEKAFRNLGFVLRACKPFKTISAIKTVYCAYVRSVLEYASPIWTPQYIIYKERLERIQKIFINHINYRLRKSATTYVDSCRHNGLLTLEERRVMLDMCLLYDIVNGCVDCTELVSSVAYRTPVRRTRHTALLHVPRHATNYASNATLTRIARTHNTLFKDIDLYSCSKISFKTHILNYFKNR